MGYLTDYSLEIVCKPEYDYEKSNFYDGLRKKYGEDINELIETGEIFGKFYDLDKDIGQLAKTHPNLLIILKGNGEESLDIWETRYKGSLSETVEASMPRISNPLLLIPKELEEQ